MRPEKPRGRNDSRQERTSNPIHFSGTKSVKRPLCTSHLCGVQRGDPRACDRDAALDVGETIERNLAFNRLEGDESLPPALADNPKMDGVAGSFLRTMVGGPERICGSGGTEKHSSYPINGRKR